MAVYTFPAATNLTVQPPVLGAAIMQARPMNLTVVRPVIDVGYLYGAPRNLAVARPTIGHPKLYPLFPYFDGQVELTTDWEDDDPEVVVLNRLKYDTDDGDLICEQLFSNHNDGLSLEVTGPSLVGRSELGRGAGHKIMVVPPLLLENDTLSAIPPDGTVMPLMDSGGGAVGVSAKYAREDHVHPTDTTIATGLALKVAKAGDSMSGSLLPSVTGTINLGSAAFRWGTVYTADLSLSNGIGDWTIVEGEDDLFLYNNKKNKVYKFMLYEVAPVTAPPKKA